MQPHLEQIRTVLKAISIAFRLHLPENGRQIDLILMRFCALIVLVQTEKCSYLYLCVVTLCVSMALDPKFLRRR